MVKELYHIDLPLDWHCERSEDAVDDLAKLRPRLRRRVPEILVCESVDARGSPGPALSKVVIKLCRRDLPRFLSSCGVANFIEEALDLC